MADSLRGIGSPRPSPTPGLDGGRRRVPVPQVDVDEERREVVAEPAQRHYVHVEGRRFDLSAPRGTYLNILV